MVETEEQQKQWGIMMLKEQGYKNFPENKVTVAEEEPECWCDNCIDTDYIRYEISCEQIKIFVNVTIL